MSSGEPIRFNGVFATIFFFSFSFNPSGSSIAPGAIVLTVILGASVRANPTVKAITPAFEMQ